MDRESIHEVALFTFNELRRLSDFRVAGMVFGVISAITLCLMMWLFIFWIFLQEKNQSSEHGNWKHSSHTSITSILLVVRCVVCMFVCLNVRVFVHLLFRSSVCLFNQSFCYEVKQLVAQCAQSLIYVNL